MPHNLSVHPGGVVITPKPIDRYAPVQTAAKGVPIVQFDKDGVEDAGLVKLDLLGNRSLSTIRYTCDLVHSSHGRRIELESLPPHDAATLRTLQTAATVGCNQIESPAMRHLLRAMQPEGVEDLMQALALIRPGAASIGMKDTFIRRHRGLEPIPPGHPAVDRLLKETVGVMLYEDDVMRVAAALLGVPLAAADRFRKAVQKCRDDDPRRELSERFLAACRRRSVSDAYAKSIWVQMAKFNAYSFCRAHAASYAQLAYALAYLKTHFAPEFWVAALNNNQSMYHPRVYVEQAKRAGVRFRLPDVNRSDVEFRLDGPSVRVGFNRVAGLGPAAVEALLDARRHKPFEGLSDCLYRSGLGFDEARALVLCGAFDAFGRRRSGLMMELELFFSSGLRRRPHEATLLAPVAAVPAALCEYGERRLYMDERRILGISVRGHLMELYRPQLAGQVDADSRDLPRREGRRVRIAGLLEAFRVAEMRHGGDVTFLTLDDEYGLFEVLLVAKAAGRGVCASYGPHIIEGTVREQHGTVTVAAVTVVPVVRVVTERVCTVQ